jgi:hypothetical protein
MPGGSWEAKLGVLMTVGIGVLGRGSAQPQAKCSRVHGGMHLAGPPLGLSSVDRIFIYLQHVTRL